MTTGFPINHKRLSLISERPNESDCSKPETNCSEKLQGALLKQLSILQDAILNGGMDDVLTTLQGDGPLGKAVLGLEITLNLVYVGNTGRRLNLPLWTGGRGLFRKSTS